MNTPITLIIGPTAIGKSDYAINLAKQTGAEIISADAFQVYRGMDIGTGKVLPHEQQGIPHHLIDTKNIDEPYSVNDFLAETNAILDTLAKQQKPAIICGGTGFYINSFLHQVTFSPGLKDQALREQLMSEYKQKGGQEMWENLALKDPHYAQTVSPNDTHRVVRALELIILGKGKPLSELISKQPTQRSDVSIIGLTADRTTVVTRIHDRIDAMFENGFVEEVQSLQHKGFNPRYQSFKALGYPEIVSYLSGSIHYNDMLECIKIKTRQFAKRQMTWFKKIHYVHWTKIS
jgi:tRNA dimethylallyltransferase